VRVSGGGHGTHHEPNEGRVSPEHQRGARPQPICLTPPPPRMRITSWRAIGRRRRRRPTRCCGGAQSARPGRELQQGVKNRIGDGTTAVWRCRRNAVFFRIGVLAYNLFIGFKRLACLAAMGGADDRDGALEAGAGSGANPAPCGARGLAPRAGGEALACWHTIRQRAGRWASWPDTIRGTPRNNQPHVPQPS